MDQIQTTQLTAQDALKRIKEERARLHAICNKLSQIKESTDVQLFRLDNLEKHVRNFLI